MVTYDDALSLGESTKRTNGREPLQKRFHKKLQLVFKAIKSPDLNFISSLLSSHMYIPKRLNHRTHNIFSRILRPTVKLSPFKSFPTQKTREIRELRNLRESETLNVPEENITSESVANTHVGSTTISSKLRNGIGKKQRRCRIRIFWHFFFCSFLINLIPHQSSSFLRKNRRILNLLSLLPRNQCDMLSSNRNMLPELLELTKYRISQPHQTNIVTHLV